MELKTRVFDLCPKYYSNITKMSQAMGISVGQAYRVLQGKRHINSKFIIGAIKAFPRYNLGELFYLEKYSKEDKVGVKPEELREAIKLAIDKATTRNLYEKLDILTDEIMSLVAKKYGVYATAWQELYKCFGESLQQDEMDLMDSVLRGVIAEMEDEEARKNVEKSTL